MMENNYGRREPHTRQKEVRSTSTVNQHFRHFRLLVFRHRNAKAMSRTNFLAYFCWSHEMAESTPRQRRHTSSLSPQRASSAPHHAHKLRPDAGIACAGIILVREPPQGELEVLIGRYEVINAFRSERQRLVPMRFAGEYHFPGGAKRQTDLGPLQTARWLVHAAAQ